MAPRIIRVLIVALSSVAFAASYSTAALARLDRFEYLSKRVTAFTASARHLGSVQDPAPQPNEIRLTPGKTSDQQISRDEIQSFAFELRAGQYAEVDFGWFGLNLGIAVLDPDGKKLLPNDSTLNSNGPLSISILADKGGIYRLNVKPIVSPKIRGKYQVMLGEPHKPTTEDRTRLEAQQRISEAQSASRDTIEAYAKAIEAVATAAARLEALNDSNGAARTLMWLGDAYRDAPKELQDLRKARASYERAAANWKLSGYPRGEGYAKVSVGQLLQSRVPVEAFDYYKQARLLFEPINDQRGQADALYGQSFSLMRMGQPSQALPLLEQTIELRRADGDLIGQARALNLMGDAYRILGEANKSSELYDQSLKKIDGLGQRSLEAAIAVNKGLVYHDQGFWEQAKEQYDRALPIYDSILEEKTITVGCDSKHASKNRVCSSAALTIDNLGQVYTSLGQFERGIKELEWALSIWLAIGETQTVNQAATMLHIGYAKFLMGRTQEALSDYDSARKLQQEAKNAAGVALTNTYIGLAYASVNEPERALSYYNDALSQQRTAGDKRALAITLDNLGMAQQLTRNSKDALANLSSALTLWRTIKDPDGEALTLYHNAIVQAATADLIAANQTSEAAIKLVESLRTRLHSDRSRTAYLAEKQDYYKLDIDLKMRLSRSGQPETYVTAAFESNEKARARVLLDSLAEAGVVRSISGRTASSNLQSLRDQRDSVEKKLAAKAAARTTFLANEHTDKQIAVFDSDISQLSEKYYELEQAIKFEDPRFALLVRPQPASLSPIQRQLDDDTLLLEYSLGEQRSYVWAVTPNSIDGFRLPPRDVIEAVAKRITNSLADRNRTVQGETGTQGERRRERANRDFEAASADLSEMVIRPLARLLGNKRLVIVADGDLQRVSFAALPLPGSIAEKPRRLIDDHEIVYEPSASVLALQRSELAGRKRAPHAVAILANPVFASDDARVVALTERNPPTNAPKSGGNPLPANATRGQDVTRALEDIGLERFPRLESSADEAQKIVKVAPQGESKTALDFDASREAAMSSELSQFRIVHFATHAVVNYEHPELSGIVLSLVDRKGQPRDGYLRLHDIYNLNLPADLIVLSACQTGVGKEIKGEGLIALTRGFMYAGAERVVASLWKVNDAATAELMAQFYKQMFVNGQRPAAALRAAQITLAKRRLPADWAGFVLQGEWK